MKLAELDQRIKAVCPIDGISSDGRIDFSSAATAEQRAAGQAMFDAFWPLDGLSAQDMEEAVQDHLDATAAAYGYDSIYTACTYADEPAVALFQAEGQALRAWRSLVWAYCHDVMAAVQAGARTAPTAAELVTELPALVMP